MQISRPTSFALFFIYISLLLLICLGKFPFREDIPEHIIGIPIDKLFHFFMFLPFPLLTYLCFGRNCPHNKCAALFAIITFISGCVLAVVTELAQWAFTKYRSGDIEDFITDGIALVLASLLIYITELARIREMEDVE